MYNLPIVFDLSKFTSDNDQLSIPIIDNKLISAPILSFDYRVRRTTPITGDADISIFYNGDFIATFSLSNLTENDEHIYSISNDDLKLLGNDEFNTYMDLNTSSINLLATNGGLTGTLEIVFWFSLVPVLPGDLPEFKFPYNGTEELLGLQNGIAGRAFPQNLNFYGFVYFKAAAVSNQIAQDTQNRILYIDVSDSNINVQRDVEFTTPPATGNAPIYISHSYVNEFPLILKCPQGSTFEPPNPVIQPGECALVLQKTNSGSPPYPIYYVSTPPAPVVPVEFTDAQSQPVLLVAPDVTKTIQIENIQIAVRETVTGTTGIKIIAGKNIVATFPVANLTQGAILSYDNGSFADVSKVGLPIINSTIVAAWIDTPATAGDVLVTPRIIRS